MTLIERLEAAEAGGRELDRDVHAALVADEFFAPRDRPFQHYTTSLDAALALAERVLPGWHWQMDLEPGRAWFQGALEPWPEGLVASDRDGVYVHAPTPALALCIAILKAKEAEK